MSDVVSINGSQVPEDSDRRTLFLERVAAAFDNYVDATEEEPDAITFCLGGLKQTTQVSWMVSGESKGGASGWLALCVASILREVVS